MFTVFIYQSSFVQVINIDNGSYTTTCSGTDAAGRNGFPFGSLKAIGVAATKSVLTNDWWSDKIKNNHSSNLFNSQLPQGMYLITVINDGKRAVLKVVK